MKKNIRIIIAIVLVFVCLISSVYADTMQKRVFIAQEGKGYLEKVGNQLVIHIKGTPEEMGTQQGKLLKSHILAMLSRLDQTASEYIGGSDVLFQVVIGTVWNTQKKYSPNRYQRELNAMAKAVGIEYDRIFRANTIPEFFHCSGFAVFGEAVKDGNLYHGRILDYAIGWGLQEHSVVIIAEPDGLIPFVNVTYTGFAGSVTGMNLKGIAFGEMGGGGQGKWEGVPMSFLMRMGMEEASTLDEAKKIFSDNKRTCEYYYVISDANIPNAVGVAATPEKIDFIGPNEAKLSLDTPIKDVVALSAGDRYKLLTQRIKDNWGKLDAKACLELMKRPVAMESCLHAVLMSAKTQEIWVAHATKDGQPASEQPYTYLNIKELMLSRSK